MIKVQLLLQRTRYLYLVAQLPQLLLTGKIDTEVENFANLLKVDTIPINTKDRKNAQLTKF